MICRHPVLSGCLLLACALPAHAAKWRIDGKEPVVAGTERSAPAPEHLPGVLTTDLLAMQAEGRAASTTPQAMIPEVRDKVGERYLKTHERLIPETFYGTTFGNKK